MWWTSGKVVLKAYIVLWITAVGGILGANLSTIIGMSLFVTENKSVYVQPWTQAGWYIGTVLFLVGAIFGRLRLINGTSLGKSPSSSTDVPATVEDQKPSHTKQQQSKGQSSLFGCMAGFGLAGAIGGLLLGASLLVFWFSFAYSPFSGKDAAASVQVVQEPGSGASLRRNVIQSDHPIALYLCLTPAVLGSVAGATAGAVISLKYRGEVPCAKVQD